MVPLHWPSELDLMARLAGLTLRARWAGWDASPFTAESPSHVSVWEKPGRLHAARLRPDRAPDHQLSKLPAHDLRHDHPMDVANESEARQLDAYSGPQRRVLRPSLEDDRGSAEEDGPCSTPRSSTCSATSTASGSSTRDAAMGTCAGCSLPAAQR